MKKMLLLVFFELVFNINHVQTFTIGLFKDKDSPEIQPVLEN